MHLLFEPEISLQGIEPIITLTQILMIYTQGYSLGGITYNSKGLEVTQMVN